MRMPVLADLAQGIPSGIPVPLPLPAVSYVGINAYVGGYPVPGREGAWEGHEPLKGAQIVITVPMPLRVKRESTAEGMGDEPLVFTATTPSGGFIKVPVPVPVGTEVEVAVSHDGETQRQIVGTGGPNAGITAEFFFKTSKSSSGDVPTGAIVVSAVLVLGILGYLVWTRP